MKQRDEAIKDAAARYGVAQEEVRQKIDKLGRLRTFTAEQQAANNALLKELHQLEKKIEKFRGEFADAKTRLAIVHEAGEEVRAQLSAATACMSKNKSEIDHLTALLETKRQALAALTQRCAQAKSKMKKELLNSKEKDDGLHQAEAFCKHIETTYENLEKQVKKGREELFEASQNYSAQETLNQTTNSEINSSQAALRNLGLQLQKLDQERQRQQELLYAVEFQSQLMQRKVARAAGHRGVAEKKDLQAKIAKLEIILTQQCQQCQMLNTQTKRLESELRKSQRAFQRRESEASALENNVADSRLECEFLKREVLNTQKEKELVGVQQDTLKLDVRRLREQLREQTEALTAAENEKLQSQHTIEEEILKAEHRLELAKTAARAVDEERHRLALEASNRKAKITNLQSKYAVVVQKIHLEEGDGGGERSQAYYIIKAGQEKEELQRIGDELDQRIRDAESESRSLSLTLDQLRAANGQFRRALSEESSFVQNQKEVRDDLEKQVKDARDAVFDKKERLRGLQEELSAERERFHEAERFFHTLRTRKQESIATLEGLRREVESQQEKLRRAVDRHKRAVKLARKKKLLPPAKPVSSPSSRPTSPPSSLGFNPTLQTNLEMEPHLESLRHHLQALRASLA
ncbi:hypothetical protein NCLIV_062060 [Neospora caninum Liverpool]|uniref:Uncharacterized protein n=1 Tax=Neospora caninum (strain Liverpool) TaxID=572307 RepID=F0VPY3_NEOCL|nr:hypothetical protein NCLIV_062060 [Neospora caninum Liverpool]CBZ55780.1 hypothetical protein NCLIV_062060 [Neospora caninum Liverpool]|eukprot:XP_003885806.1 hypothetical protein NCLIV_062060 [Neospora caninum Liverpool]